MTARRARTDSERPELIWGAHPVLEALTVRPEAVERVLVAREGGRGPRGRIIRIAREAGVPVSHVPREVLAREVGSREATHQGIAARVAAHAYAEAEEVLRRASAEADGTLLVLDGVEDPRNLGAIARTAAATGVAGLLLSAEGTVGLTAAAGKASAGALERIPVARVRRPGETLANLKGAGFRVAALEPRGETSWDRASLTGKIAIVVGGEGRGIRPSLLRHADERVAIPLAEGVESLNVSVAVAVLLFEAVRQRRCR